jgi:peptide deformylase
MDLRLSVINRLRFGIIQYGITQYHPLPRPTALHACQAGDRGPGIGLAATQVDVHVQVIVMDISEAKNELRVFINPRITESDGMQEYEEGCLSVPGIYENVSRPEKITVEALDQQGNSFKIKADGLLAVCIQHEMDHLKGKVFVQYLSKLKQSRIKSKMKKRLRETM